MKDTPSKSSTHEGKPNESTQRRFESIGRLVLYAAVVVAGVLLTAFVVSVIGYIKNLPDDLERADEQIAQGQNSNESAQQRIHRRERFQRKRPWLQAIANTISIILGIPVVVYWCLVGYGAWRDARGTPMWWKQAH